MLKHLRQPFGILVRFTNITAKIQLKNPTKNKKKNPVHRSTPQKIQPAVVQTNQTMNTDFFSTPPFFRPRHKNTTKQKSDFSFLSVSLHTCDKI